LIQKKSCAKLLMVFFEASLSLLMQRDHWLEYGRQEIIFNIWAESSNLEGRLLQRIIRIQIISKTIEESATVKYTFGVLVLECFVFRLYCKTECKEKSNSDKCLSIFLPVLR
jgi:hypothetical protein